MNDSIVEKLSKIEREVKRQNVSDDTNRCLQLLEALIDYFSDNSFGINFYTEAALEVAIYRARAEDVSRARQDSIIIDELRRSNEAHKHRADYFEQICTDLKTSIAKNQTEISSLSLTVLKHQRNYEAGQTELIRIKKDLEECQKVNASLVSSISSQDRATTAENAKLKAKMESLTKSEKDYSDAFKSTKRKLQLCRRQHQELLGLSEMDSPMGSELDTSSLTWEKEALVTNTFAGLLLAADGTSSHTTVELLASGISGESLCIDLNFDLSDANCMV